MCPGRRGTLTLEGSKSMCRPEDHPFQTIFCSGDPPFQGIFQLRGPRLSFLKKKMHFQAQLFQILAKFQLLRNKFPRN